MKIKDKRWLLNEFPTFIGKTIRRETLQAYLKAEMLLLEKDQIRPRGCTCEYRALKNTVELLYKQFVSKQESS